jgi:L-iditol 2-dehydrogenase/L-gulonate 5-dehydrogenase
MGVSVTVTAPGQWTVQPAVAAAMGPDEVRLTLVSAGICGGDVALLRGENAVASYPLVLGHECVGRVVEAGPQAGLTVGQYVVVFPTSSCGACDACQAGRVNHCTAMRVRGLSHPSGCFADELVVPAGQLLVLPDDVAERYGALVEPVAVACHVATRAAPLTGLRVLVVGAGVIGSLLALLARSRGAAVVLAADRHESRRGNAMALGADQFTTASGPDLVSWVDACGGPVDVVLDTVCAPDTVDAAIEALRPGGRLVTVASANPDQRLSPRYDRFFLKELSVIAARNYTPSDFVCAIELLSTERPDLSTLVTGQYPLDDFDRALSALGEAPQRHLKILLGPSGRRPDGPDGGVRR